ncbi:NLRC3, partial [Symbiodinium natans]
VCLRRHRMQPPFSDVVPQVSLPGVPNGTEPAEALEVGPRNPVAGLRGSSSNHEEPHEDESGTGSRRRSLLGQVAQAMRDLVSIRTQVQHLETLVQDVADELAPVCSQKLQDLTELSEAGHADQTGRVQRLREAEGRLQSMRPREAPEAEHHVNLEAPTPLLEALEAARRPEEPSHMPSERDEDTILQSSGAAGPESPGADVQSSAGLPAEEGSASASSCAPEHAAYSAKVPKGIRAKDVAALVEENREWMEEPTEREGLTGSKNMYDICANLIIAKTTSIERVVELSQEDVEAISRSLETGATESIFEKGTLQCRKGVRLGGVPVEHLTIQGILCEEGDLRVKYWQSGDERHHTWMTTEKHGRMQGVAAIPEKLRGLKLGEKNARRNKKRLKVEGTVVVLRSGVAFVDVTEQGKFAPLCGFVSHYWGQETIEFSQILLQHAKKVYPEDPGEVCYYVCTFSNNQHCVDLGGDDLAQSPFNLALEHIASCYRERQEPMYGAVMMFDAACAPLTRIWCVYEIFRCHSLGLTLDLFSIDGQLSRTSKSPLMNLIIEQLTEINLKDVGSSEREDKLKIEAKISEHPGGWTAVLGKIQLQVMDLLTFAGSLAITRNIFTGKQVEPEEIELKDLSTGEVRLSNAIIDACIEGQLRRILLLGPGGSGKTVFTREVVRRVVDWARQDPAAAGVVPVRVPLAELAQHVQDFGEDPLWSWAERAFGTDSRELFRGDVKLLLVLDGFDEAGAARRRIVDWLQGWLEAHSSCCVCVVMTSRPSGTDQVLEADDIVRDAMHIPVLAQLSETRFVTPDPLPEKSYVELQGSYVELQGSSRLATNRVASIAQGFWLTRVELATKLFEVFGKLIRRHLDFHRDKLKVRRKDPRRILSAALMLQGPADAARARDGVLEQMLREAGGDPTNPYKMGIVWTDGTCEEDHKIEDIELHHPPYAVYLCQMLAEGGGLQGREVDDTDVTLQLAGECHFLLTGDLQVGDVIVLSDEEESKNLQLLPHQRCFVLTMDRAVTECPAEFTELTTQTELATGLCFQPLELLPLTKIAAARIAKCRQDELCALATEVWQTPLMASLLGKYREEHEELPAAAGSELELMRFAVEALLAQAEQRTGSSGLREVLRHVCLRTLEDGQRLLQEADFAGKEVVFHEALRGHLSFFEPATGQDAVQIYHLRMHELLAAEAWRDSEPPARHPRGWQNAFGKVQVQRMLQGALRYFLMLEMPDMAQGPEVQVDLSGMRHPLAAAETEILLDGLPVCLEPLTEKFLLHLPSDSSVGPKGARGLTEALRRCKVLRELDFKSVDIGLGLEAKEAAAANALHGLQELTHLKLDLSNNQCGTKGCSSLAEALSHLPMLTAVELVLDYLDLGAEEAVTLASALRSLQDLTQLKLSFSWHCTIRPEGWQSLAEALGHLPKLAALELDLQWCQAQLGAEEAATLASALRGLQDLTRLKLHVQIGPEGCHSLAEALGHLPKLAALDLLFSNCKRGLCIDDVAFFPGVEAAAALPDALAGLHELQQLTLNLMGWQTGAEWGASLARSLTAISELRELNLCLHSIQLGAEGGAALAQTLVSLNKLRKLNLTLDWAELGEDGGKSLAQALGQLLKLTKLRLEISGLRTEEAVALAGALGNLTELREVNLLFGKSPLVGLPVCLKWAEALRQLTAMAKLVIDLHGCGIGEEEKPELRAALGALLATEKQIWL